MTKQETLYVTYVVTTPEKMWTALTDGELSKKYFFGRRVKSDWKVDSAFKMWQPNGTLDGRRLQSLESRGITDASKRE